MPDFPGSLPELIRRFPDAAACADWLIRQRWPAGFVCPACGGAKAWRLEAKAHTFECAGCGRQTSVTAGTLMHGSKLPLTLWFQAAFLFATHSNGMSAVQLKEMLGLGSYKTAWLLLAKLRRAMVAPGRQPLAGFVEVDETYIPLRRKDEPPAGGFGRSSQGKICIAGAVEFVDAGPRRIRLAPITDASTNSLAGFVAGAVARGAQMKTDGWSAYGAIPDVKHDSHVIGPMAAHILLPWTHRIFANLKRWALGVYHGLRAKHLQSYLDEFTFRFNRRRNRHAAFQSLFKIAAAAKPVTYNMLIKPEPTG
jgi:predicted RNA-binding Zn-ribbon protein involved in translation (DUF1610 family)